MFDAPTIDRLADVVAAAVIERLEPNLAPSAAEDGWIDSRDAAKYLGLSVDGLHKLTAARQVAFSQTVSGAPCYFRRSDLDAYRMQFMRDVSA